MPAIRRQLNLFFLASYLVVILIGSGYLPAFSPAGLPVWGFALAVLLSYGAAYLLPAFILSHLVAWLGCRRRPAGRSCRLPVALTAVGTVSLTELFLFLDRTVFRLFGFHVNGFVFNLITTPGGISSMGYGREAVIAVVLLILVLLAGQAGLYLLLARLARHRPAGGRRFPVAARLLLVLLLLCGLVAQVAYGVAEIRGCRPLLVAADHFPLYQPLTFKKLAKKMGFAVARRREARLPGAVSALRYPRRPLVVKPPARPYNLVWLTVESWRRDTVTPEIMPATWAFARRANWFTNHYSGGNGTRMGLFSLFYGLYGPYWFSFLAEQRRPALLDVLQQEGYQLSLYTSARFSYPEFDRTIFAGVPKNCLHEYDQGPGWRRDRYNVTRMLDFIRHRNPARPFMTFMFFESPHARYYFPPESVVRPDYLEDFNYATMNLERDIELIRNRYLNACHHLDSQLRRVLDFLERHHLLASTIVVLTGDHGEEFMEKGRWGHNSAFHQEQIRPPLILWLPGRPAGKHDWLTSHLDVVPTIMPLLGVENPPGDYCLGEDLFTGRRRFTVVADWSRICIVGPDFKAVYPVRSGSWRRLVTTVDDQPVSRPESLLASRREIIGQVMRDLARFKKKP